MPDSTSDPYEEARYVAGKLKNHFGDAGFDKMQEAITAATGTTFLGLYGLIVNAQLKHLFEKGQLRDLPS